MNIAMLQVTNANPLQNTAKSTATKTDSSESDSFGKVFDAAVASTKTPQQENATTNETTTVEDVETTLEQSSLQGVFEELGIVMDEAGLFAFIGEEGELVAIDEMLNLETLTQALGMTEEQLVQVIEQLLGEEMQEITDVWSLIEQAPAILSQLVSALQGNQQIDVQPKQLQQVAQVLKLAEHLGQKTDTVYQQEFQLSQLKDTLQSALTQVQQTIEQQTVVQTAVQTAVQTTVQQTAVQQVAATSSFQQTLQQVTTQQTTKVESENSQPVVQPTTVTQTKIVTVTLPVEKPAQSEALVKEIQNLINRSQLSGQQGNMKLLLRLFPENLGQIRIELVQKDGMLTARLLASTALGKELLDTNLNQLKASLGAQNIQMDRIDVAQSLQDAERGNRDQNFLNNFFHQQTEQEKDESDEDDDEEKLSFSELLDEEVE